MAAIMAVTITVTTMTASIGKGCTAMTGNIVKATLADAMWVLSPACPSS
jgi:hypothetical protein